MKVIRLILSGYKRLSLSFIDYFEITPKETLQLILGTNGSGKSSVLSEMTPFPSHHSNFVVGGYKKIEVEHHGKLYCLTSTYSGGSGNHSFICTTDDEELNPGGTVKAFQTVVEQTFGWDKGLMDLMLGRTRFTSMSVAERRQWLTRLCSVDLDPAFKLFKHFTSSERDQRGVINSLGKRLVSESQQILDENTIEQLKGEVKRHHDALIELYPLKQDRQSTGAFDTAHWKQEVTQLLKQKITVPSFPLKAGSFDVTRKSLERDIALTNQYYETLLKQLEDTQRYLSQYNDDGGISLDVAKQQVKLLKDKHDILSKELTSLPKTRLPLIDAIAAGLDESRLKELTGRFNELLTAIPDNEEGHFNLERGKEAERKLQQASTLKRNKEDEILNMQRRIAQMKSCESVTCPQCTHHFKPGIDPNEEPQLLQHIQHTQSQVDKLVAPIAKLEEYLASLEEYRGFVNAFRAITQHHPEASVLWNYCIAEKVPFRTPRAYLSDLANWCELVITQRRIDKTALEYQQYEDRIALIEKTDTSSLKAQQAKAIELEKTLYETQQTSVKLNAQLKELVACINDRQLYQDRLVNAKAHYESLLNNAQASLGNAFQSGLSTEIQHHQSQVAGLEAKLHEHALKEGGRNALEQQRKDAQEDQKHYALLAAALNPTEGLIGQYLKASMGNIVHRLNTLIDRIWSYPLEVLSCPLEKEDLTYKFPLQVNDGSMNVPDIELGSSAQRDVVDFAFKLTVMSCLNRNDIPLYMDELGASFDEQHRSGLIDMIDTMLENQNLEQVFFVSHYVNTHGAFQHADICVLDPRNITVPEKFNQHVKLALT